MSESKKSGEVEQVSIPNNLKDSEDTLEFEDLQKAANHLNDAVSIQTDTNIKTSDVIVADSSISAEGINITSEPILSEKLLSPVYSGSVENPVYSNNSLTHQENQEEHQHSFSLSPPLVSVEKEVNTSEEVNEAAEMFITQELDNMNLSEITEKTCVTPQRFASSKTKSEDDHEDSSSNHVYNHDLEKNNKQQYDFTSSTESEWEDEKATQQNNFVYDINKAQELKEKGNDVYKKALYHEALEFYTEAITYCNEEQDNEILSVLFHNCSACHSRLNEHDAAISAATRAIDLKPDYLKAYIKRYSEYKLSQKWHQAVSDLNKMFELQPSLKKEYANDYAKISALSKEQFEKEKEELVGKLKDAGNWVLNRFGLSMDNFKVEQNAGGSYNISFQQN